MDKIADIHNTPTRRQGKEMGDYAIDTCIVDYLAACGPAEYMEIFKECKTQCNGVTVSKVVDMLERLVILGSIVRGDNGPEIAIYEIASGEL